MNYKQFEIYSVNLNPTRGSEQKGIRPCIILQTNAVSDIGKTTMIAPISSKKIEKIYPYEVLLETNDINGLKVDSKIKLDQIRVIDKTRISNKIGIINDSEVINKIYGALDVLLDREGYFR